ncbi:MAG: thiol peroxidase [Armatimonadetes bacterium]|nr:thiol peroxidase [Armatimonadota bacterium]MCX7969700.1 thiol peroxidase [Armatimonadota bacterium]MDW8143892.1 thiol peroxidase [Armatimonadota bacterium]
MAVERYGVVTFRGNPLTLLGPDLQVGEKAPDFQVVDTDLNPISLSDFAGKFVLISVTPSLDTPVCDLQGRKFNELAAGLSEDVVVLNISVDLPFAQKRWCGANNIDRIKVLSDYQDRDFGLKYGVLIKELKLLARSVWIVDKDGIIRYKQIVPEVTNEPDYDAAMAALKEIVGA